MRKDFMKYPVERDPFTGHLTPEVIEHAMWYLEGGWEHEGRTFPSVNGLCMSLGVIPQQLFRWRKRCKVLDQICEQIKTVATVILSDKALDGTYNSGMSKFMLMQIAGYREHTSNDITTNGESIHNNTPNILFDASKLSDAVLQEITNAIASSYSGHAGVAEPTQDTAGDRGVQEEIV